MFYSSPHVGLSTLHGSPHVHQRIWMATTTYALLTNKTPMEPRLWSAWPTPYQFDGPRAGTSQRLAAMSRCALPHSKMFGSYCTSSCCIGMKCIVGTKFGPLLAEKNDGVQYIGWNLTLLDLQTIAPETSREATQRRRYESKTALYYIVPVRNDGRLPCHEWLQFWNNCKLTMPTTGTYGKHMKIGCKVRDGA